MSIIVKQTVGRNIQYNWTGIFMRVSKLTPRNDVATAATLSCPQASNTFKRENTGQM